MKLLKSGNLLLAFLLEVAMLATYCYGGFHLFNNALLHMLLGLGIPLLIIIVWSIFLAPRAKHKLPLLWFLLFKLLLFCGAVFILFVIQKNELAEILGVITLLNLGLATLFHQ